MDSPSHSTSTGQSVAERSRRFGCLRLPLVGIGVILCLFCGLVWHVQRIHEASRRWRPTNTETGYRFPPLSDIAKIELDVWQSREGLLRDEWRFDAPKETWGDILDALTPSAIDARPAAWQVIGSLRIETKQGQHSFVWLYSVAGYETGAFSAGLSRDDSEYYRGGNTDELHGALKKAYEAHADRQSDQMAPAQ